MLVDVVLLSIETSAELSGSEVLQLFQFGFGENFERYFTSATRLHDKRSVSGNVDEEFSSGKVG
ncbi:MAG: hypothetical protein BMS9Abin05_0463 [Rhodothermia bacterium]|nr:MAG: hypothetical protein BMS9Abin05_0463 [Rhodothermia bacterium]